MKIRAAVSEEEAASPVVQHVDLEAPRAGEILVRMVGTGICHTDLSCHGRPGPKPMVLGHEGAGVVAAVGAAVTTLVPGDHVVLGFNFCGVCPSCLEKAPAYCTDIIPRNFGGLRPDGSSPLSRAGKPLFGRFFGQSSFATHALVDVASAVKVPKEIPLAMLGSLACGVQTGAGAVINSFKLSFGQSLVVVGAGAVGLAAVMAARLVGASRIVAVDVVPERLKLAAELGATDLVDARTQEPGAEVRKVLPHGAEFALLTAGGTGPFSQAIECLGQQGTLGYVTAPEAVTLPMLSMLKRGIRLQAILLGDAVPQSFIPAMIEYWRQGRFPFERLIRYYRFEDIQQAFQDAERGIAIKPVLTMED